MKRILFRLAAKCLKPFIFQRIKIDKVLRQKYKEAVKAGTIIISPRKGVFVRTLRFEYLLIIIPGIIEEAQENFLWMRKLMALRKTLRTA
jgi:hypothetical protein